MVPKNLLRFRWQPYVVAIALIATAAALRLWPLQALGSRLTWLTFYPAVMVAALYGGFYVGLLGTFLSCLTILFLWPVFLDHPFIQDSIDWLGMAVFVATCIMISGVAEAMRRARARERNASEQLEAANINLQEEIAERKRIEEEIQTLNAELEQRVAERTAELVKTVETLQAEMTERKRVEEVVRESEERYRSLFENMLDGYAHCRMMYEGDRPQDFVYLDVNDAFEKLTGLKDVTGKKVSEVIPGIRESNPELLEIYGRVALTGIEERFETYVDALGIWFSISVYSPKRGDFVAVFDNITERKRAVEALRESESRFRMMVESVTDYAIIMLDAGGHIVSWNAGAERIKGYQADEIVGQHFSQFYPKEDVERGEPERELAVATAEGRFEDEGWRVRKDGSRFIANMVITPLRDDEGKLRGFAKVTRDITERKRAEKAVLDAEKRYRTTLDHMLEGCQIIGFDWRYFYTNDVAAKQGRHTKEELSGRTMMEMYPGIENTEMFAELRRCMENRIPHRMENEFPFPDGTKGWFHLSMEPVPEGVFILSQDITKEKQLDEELRKHHEHLEELVKERTVQLEDANKELEAFSYSVSHDLRAPLRAIDGFSKIVIEEHSQKVTQEGLRLLKIVRDNTSKMGQLIDDLLAFSRISRQEIRKSKIDLTRMVTSILEELRTAEPGRSVDVTTQSLPTITGDTAMIRQAFMNLLSNAFKFTRRKPHSAIEIGATINSHDVELYVKDNGAGFDMTYKDKLFSVFQRLHTSDEFEGTGVGLALVQRVIHRHGGRVWADSEVGKGATFYISLPRDEK